MQVIIADMDIRTARRIARTYFDDIISVTKTGEYAYEIKFIDKASRTESRASLLALGRPQISWRALRIIVDMGRIKA